MLKKVREILGGNDEFIASTAVFPEIDRNRIAKDLKLADEGKTRGLSDQPPTESKVMDHLEQQVVAKVEDLRRRGLENYEQFRRVYSERLSKATSARMEVERSARDASSRFKQNLISYRARMVAPQNRLQDAYAYREQFRRENKLGIRPAQRATPGIKLFFFGLLLITFESVLNGYLFSQSNPLGLLGGAIAAFLVSFANVGISTLLGLGGKVVASRRILSKLLGLIVWIAFCGFAIVFNFGVAHFRDAVESIGDWKEAAEAALVTLKTAPLDLANIESWLLLCIGAAISVSSFAKGYFATDPYPGYSYVEADLQAARDAYIDTLDEAIEELEAERDKMIDELLQAQEAVNRHVSDTVDALYGQSSLGANARVFLEQCDIAANFCLSVYRDANKASRKSTAPSYFNEEFAFKNVDVAPIDERKTHDAEKEVVEVNSLIEKAQQRIFDDYDASIAAHKDIDALQGTDFAGRLDPIAPAAVPPPTNEAITKVAAFEGSSR